MRILFLTLPLIFATTLACQGVETIHNLRLRAHELMQDSKRAEAYEIQRDAALIAMKQGRPLLQAKCMKELSMIGLAENRKRSIKQLKQYERLARQTGRLDLVADAILSRDNLGDRVSKQLLFDAYLVLSQFHRINSWTRKSNKEETRKQADLALQAADIMAEARLLAKGKESRAAAQALMAAAQKVGKSGFNITGLMLLEEALAHNSGIMFLMQGIYKKSDNVRGIAAAKIHFATETPAEDKKQQVIDRLEEAFQEAGKIRNYKLQAMAARKLHKITDELYWEETIKLLEQTEIFELIADGRRALTAPFFLESDTVSRLEERLDNQEVNTIYLRLAGKAGSTDTAAFKATFKEAITGKDIDTLRWAITLAEVAGRNELLPVIAESLTNESGNPSELAAAIEELSLAHDRDILIKLLSHKDSLVVEAAAAALFRLGIEGFDIQIRAEIKRLSESKSAHILYLHGGLARLGDEDSLKVVKESAKSTDAANKLFAESILINLGFAGLMRGADDNIKNYKDKPEFIRALGRLPDSWLKFSSPRAGKGAADYPLARVWGLGGMRYRAYYTNPKNALGLIWTLPTKDEKEGFKDVFLGDRVLKIEDQESREMLDWAADSAGVRGKKLDPPKNEEDKESIIHKLIREERKTRKLTYGENERRLVLFDWDSEYQAARCTIRAKTGAALMTSATKIEIPFKWSFKRKAWAGGIVGALYKSVILGIAESDLLDKYELIIPGYESIILTSRGSENGWSVLLADLPLKLGEGLGDDQPMPLETILKGKLRVTFNFNGNIGSVEFPIRVDVPTDAEKPDLVPLQIILDPTVPEIGQEARIMLRVKNNGKSVEKNVISSVRFMVHNPQSEDGFQTLDAQVFVANGWRAGEVRTFEVRPKFVDGYYMNRFSYTFTPALGDSKIVAVIDPDNAINELDESNNQIELTVPLRHKRKKGLALAEKEVIAALADPIQKFRDSKTVKDLDDSYDKILELVDRLKERPPAVRQVISNVSEIYWFRRAKLRNETAMKKLQDAKSSGTLNREKAVEIRNELLGAQRDMMRSGTPIKIEALEKMRNTTLLASGVTAAVGDYDSMLYANNLTDSDDSVAGDASRALKALDGAMLVYIEAKRVRETGQMDMGNVMDAVANTADAIDLKLPGFGNFQREILKAELEYVDKGFRKEADAIGALSDVIAGKEGAEKRMMEAVADVEKHIKGGPFTKKSLTNIAKGWVKDIPIIGSLADIIFSWK